MLTCGLGGTAVVLVAFELFTATRLTGTAA